MSPSPGQVHTKWGFLETGGWCLFGRFLKTAASSLCLEARTLKGAETNRACAVSFLPPLSHTCMGCFSCFKTRWMGPSPCVHFFLGVGVHLSNASPLSLCAEVERIWSWGQARPGLFFCLTFLIWKMGEQWAPQGGTHEGHPTQCLAYSHWAVRSKEETERGARLPGFECWLSLTTVWPLAGPFHSAPPFPHP